MKTANEDRSSSAGQGRILAGGRKNGLIFWRERSLPPAFFIVFQKKRPPIENQNNQNSIRTGSFLLSVCCSFFVVSTFPSVACFRCRQPSLYRRERGKVFGLNTLRRRKIQSETACRLTFQLSRADVLPSQTSKGNGRMTESGNS